MTVHSTHEVRRHFPLTGPRLCLGIGALALIGFGLTTMSTSDSADEVPATKVSAAETANADHGFEITTTSWDTGPSIASPVLEAEGQLLAFEAGADWVEEEPLRFAEPMVQWQNLDIAVRRDW